MPTLEQQQRSRVFYFETAAAAVGMDVSSTEVRRRLKAKRRVDELVHPSVAAMLHAMFGVE